MALAREFCVTTGQAKQIAVNWKAPLFFNDENDELILTRNISHFAMEIYNENFPTKATDSRPDEVFRGRTIVGNDTGTISVSGDILTDTAASFSTSPKLIGRLVRDQASQVFRIVDNTATSITVELNGLTLTDGKYVILPDFVSTTRIQENYEVDIRTTADVGAMSNLVIVEDGSLVLKEFEEDELANLIFIDGAGTRLVIKSNTTNVISFFEQVTPVIGPGMAILNSHVNTSPIPYIDNYLNTTEIDARSGTGLRPDKTYYYTLFTKPVGANVAQAEFGANDSGVSTQDYAISPDEKLFGERLFEYWPGVFKDLDNSGDLEDVMQVFGFFFDELHALINTYKLQDTDNVLITALLPLSEQFGLPSVGFSIGADTLRRIAKDMISCWRIKGSKEGIAIFIRKITTWDITNGTADFSAAIQDTIPNVSALRFFDINLGSANTRFTESSPILVPGGKFATSLPGIVIPGFFTFREFVVALPNVALFVGASTSFTVQENTTTMIDNIANFGSVNSLVGNFLIPNQEEVNDIFEIISNTSTSITVRGIITNRNAGGNYAVLSPLNTNRFVILNKLLPFYIPFGTAAGFQFT